MSDRETEIDGLIDEHRELITLMGTLRRAVSEPGSNVDELLDQLEVALAHHTDREEAGLFHTLHGVEVGPEYIGLFEHDHGHFVDLLSRPTVTGTTWKPSSQGLEAHMDREENDMFPAAEQILGPAEWDAIDAAVANLR